MNKFIVNASNENLNELTLGILEPHDNEIVNFKHASFLFPVYYPFGLIYFIMEIVTLSQADKYVLD